MIIVHLPWHGRQGLAEPLGKMPCDACLVKGLEGKKERPPEEAAPHFHKIRSV
jgi:hypothetical protein